MADEPEVDPDELEPDTEAEPEPEAEVEETEADPEAEPEVEEPEPEPETVRTQEQRPASRAEKRISSQQEALRVRDQQIADLNKRLDQVLAQTAHPPQPQETPAQREQRLALLDPVERMRVELQESQVVSQRQMQQMAFTMQDSGDKASFDAKSLIDPLYAKWAPKVEAFLTELRGKGQNVAREQALKFLIGEAALAGRKVSTGKQKQAGAARIARQRTQPGNSRSDTQPNRRGGSDATALERRLENVEI